MKNYCRHCGAKLDPNQKHECPKLRVWAKIKSLFLRLANYITYDGNIETELDYYERNKFIVPESINIEDGEVTVKQYDLAILRTRHKLTRAEGRMQVTNKRLIFRAAGRSPAGKTVYQSEFEIDKIDGVEIRKDYRFLFLDFLVNVGLSSLLFAIGMAIGAFLTKDNNAFIILLSFLLSIATVVPFFMLPKRYLLKLLVLSIGSGIVGAALGQGGQQNNGTLAIFALITLLFLFILYLIAMFMSFFKPNLEVEVKTSSGSSGVQIKHRYASLLIWKKMEENSGFSEILPGKDADLAIKEIGAIINDIKTLGDLGVDKWKE